MHFEGSPDEVECAGNDLRRAERRGWEGGVTLLQCILKLPVNDSKRGRSREATGKMSGLKDALPKNSGFMLDLLWSRAGPVLRPSQVTVDQRQPAPSEITLCRW